MLKTRVGYTGGPTSKPTYSSVCGGDGHSEAIRIWYDPSVLSYEALLQVFLKEHDPTYKTKPQYMSAVWYGTEEEQKCIEKVFAAYEGKWKKKIATAVLPEKPWTDAEEYHQKYIEKQTSRCNI